MPNLKRCAWVPSENEKYIEYHDEEWGVAVHDDPKLFEFLVLEGAQAGLSWVTILNKREGYRSVFKNFDPAKVAAMTDFELEEILKNPQIVRNRLKVFSVRKNAIVFLQIQKEYGSFDKYLWDFVGGKTIVGKWQNISEVPVSTDLSDKISKDLKKRGMSFVGSTIIYSYLQAVGVVNDHTVDCFRFSELSAQ